MPQARPSASHYDVEQRRGRSRDTTGQDQLRQDKARHHLHRSCYGKFVSPASLVSIPGSLKEKKKPRNMDSASQHPRAVLSLTVSRASACLTEVVKVLYHAVGSQQISAPRPLPLAPSGIRGARSVQPVPVFHPIDTGWLGVRNEVGFRSDVSRATCRGEGWHGVHQPDSRRTWLAVQFTSGRSGALWLHSSMAMLGPSSHRRTCELGIAAFIGGCVSGIHSWTKPLIPGFRPMGGFLVFPTR